MFDCIKCGRPLAETEMIGGVCYPCESVMSPSVLKELKKAHKNSNQLVQDMILKKEKERIKQNALAIESKSKILLTTEMSPMGLNIINRHGIVTSECVFGINLFRDFFNDVRDVFGGRSSASQKVLRDGRKIVLTELRQEAFDIKANAVVAIQFNYSEISGKNKSMLLVTAAGTAVTICE